MIKYVRKKRGLSPRGAIMLAPAAMPDIVAMIAEEFPNTDPKLRKIIILRCYGFSVSEIAKYLKTYRNAVYRVLWKIQREM